MGALAIGRGTSRLEEHLAARAFELRLPVRHIKGTISTPRRTDVNWDENSRRDFLIEIERETDRLSQLVEGLLESHGPVQSFARTE